MWFHLGFQNFVAKKTLNNDSFDIFITDCMRIWYKSLANDELLSISQKLNPLFEAPVQKLRDLTLNLLGDVKVKKEIKEEDNNILLKLEANVMNAKFQFHVKLSQGDAAMLYKEFTLPLLLALVKIQNREMKLIDIIRDKDAEIKDYKQGYGISSNYLTTKPFSKKEFYNQESTTDLPWDDSFLNCISSKLLAIESEIETGSQVKAEEKPEREHFVDASNKKNSTFKDNCVNQSSGSKPCVLLDNKVIKRRKQHNDRFKIKF